MLIGGVELAVLFALMLIPWIAFSVWVASWAKRRGHGFVAYLLLGLLASPAISLVVLLIASAIIGDRDESTRHVHASPSRSRLDALKTLSELRDSGTLSPAEFETEKARIMNEPA